MRILWARIESAIAERRELVQALLTYAQTVRCGAGAASVQLAEDLESPGVYSMISRWHRAEDFEAHLAGPDFGILLGALEVLGVRTGLSLTHAEFGDEDPIALIRRLRGRTPALVEGYRHPEANVRVDTSKMRGLA